MDAAAARITSGKLQEDDVALDTTLRPRRLEEFIGQLTLAREAERKLRVLGRPGSKYDRIMQLYEADAVLRRAGFELPKPGAELRQVGAQVRRERRE